jgi:hypothetical protein
MRFKPFTAEDAKDAEENKAIRPLFLCDLGVLGGRFGVRARIKH